MTDTIILGVNGVLLTIIGYFLVQTMNKLNNTSEKTDRTANDVALLKQETSLKHDRLEEKLDDLKNAIVGLTNELKAKKHNGG